MRWRWGCAQRRPGSCVPSGWTGSPGGWITKVLISSLWGSATSDRCNNPVWWLISVPRSDGQWGTCQEISWELFWVARRWNRMIPTSSLWWRSLLVNPLVDMEKPLGRMFLWGCWMDQKCCWCTISRPWNPVALLGWSASAKTWKSRVGFIRRHMSQARWSSWYWVVYRYLLCWNSRLCWFVKAVWMATLWLGPGCLTMSGQRSAVTSAIRAIFFVFTAQLAGVVPMAVRSPGPRLTEGPRGSNNHQWQASWKTWWTALTGSLHGVIETLSRPEWSSFRDMCVDPDNFFFCFFNAGPWRSSVGIWCSTLSSRVESCDFFWQWLSPFSSASVTQLRHPHPNFQRFILCTHHMA